MDDMTRGYLDGLSKDAVEPGRNRSASYTHGWLNGRDDRRHAPRDTAANLRQKAKEAVVTARAALEATHEEQ